MDYNEFSEKIKAKYPQYKDIDNKELAEKMIAKYPQYKEQVKFESLQKEQPTGIDLTPNGIANKIIDTTASAIETPVYMLKNKQGIGKAFKQASENVAKTRAEMRKQSPVLSGLTDFGNDLLGYSYLPILKGANIPAKIGAFAGNAALQGGLPGALEGLKSGHPLGGGLTGTGIAAGIQALPYVGNVAKLIPATGSLISKTVGRVKPETLKRAVQADSKALDLTEEKAQNLLMDTTEDVRRAYNDILAEKGNEVGQALGELPEHALFDKQELLQEIDKIYNNYSLSNNPNLNPAMNATQREYSKIKDMFDSTIFGDKLSAQELYDINKNISNMTDWNAVDAATKNDVLEQIYGAYADKISGLSPKLEEANKVYSNLMDFQKNEGIRQILNKQNNIDTASSKLKNYNSTVTKGNTNRNIQDLEKILVQEGYQPFLNNIDDVNAAMDLLNIRGTGDSWLANLATQATRPVLGLARKYNRSNLPQIVDDIKTTLSPLAEKLIAPSAVKATVPLFYGGVEYNDYQK